MNFPESYKTKVIRLAVILANCLRIFNFLLLLQFGNLLSSDRDFYDRYADNAEHITDAMMLQRLDDHLVSMV